MKWWFSQKPASSCRVILFQVDISGHSAWVNESPTDLGPAKKRAEFAELLERRLSYLGFDRLHWLGDGGLFAKKFEDSSDANDVCRAASVAFDWFREWSRPEWGLTLRATAAYIPNVIVDRDPGYWCSQRLNAFLKYEREFALQNSFTITDDLRRVMDPDGECYRHFTLPRQVNLPSGESVTTWIDTELSDATAVAAASQPPVLMETLSRRDRLLEDIQHFRIEMRRDTGR